MSESAPDPRPPAPPPPSDEGNELDVSVVISTFNRRDALLQTLEALGDQTLPPHRYEVLVVDDGSDDGTAAAAAAVRLPCALRVFRHLENRGVSAGRNLALRNARGRFAVLLSDDLLVPPEFLGVHLETLRRFPGWWVVGGFRQLPALRETPFGRYLEELESSFTAAAKLRRVEDDLWELSVPTARNLSLPRRDLDRTGLFDERFQRTCEDQDLADRARKAGIRFLYNEGITSLHNDQAGDLRRCCRAQRRGTHDTALFCAKHPDVHGNSSFARLDGPITLRDGPRLVVKKLAKSVLSTPPALSLLFAVVAAAERLGVPERALRVLYRSLIGLHTFRGWREGLRTLRETGAAS